MAPSHLGLSAGPQGVCGTTEKFQHPVFCSGQLVRVMNIAFKWAGGPSIEQRPPMNARRVVQRLSAGADIGSPGRVCDHGKIIIAGFLHQPARIYHKHRIYNQR